VLCGSQAIFFAIGTKVFAIREGFVPQDSRIDRFHRWFPLERCLALSGLSLLVGLTMLTVAVARWWRADFDLHTDVESRFVVAGSMFTALGVQSTLASFFLSILGMLRK
jgi:hypothetical protein